MSREKYPGTHESREILKPWDAIVLRSVNIIEAIGYERESEGVRIQEANWEDDENELHFLLKASSRPYIDSSATDFRLSVASQLTRIYHEHYSYNNHSNHIFEYDSKAKQFKPMPRKKHDQILPYIVSAPNFVGAEEDRRFHELAANFALQVATTKRKLGTQAIQPHLATPRTYDRLLQRIHKKEPMLSEGDIQGAIIRQMKGS